MDITSAFLNGICTGPLLLGSIIFTLANEIWVTVTKQRGLLYLYTDNSEYGKKLMYVLSFISTIFIFPLILMFVYSAYEYKLENFLLIGLWLAISSVLFAAIRLGTYEFAVDRRFLIIAWLASFALSEYGLLYNMREIGGIGTVVSDGFAILVVLGIAIISQITIATDAAYYTSAEEEQEMEEENRQFLNELKKAEEKKINNKTRKRKK